MKYVKGYVCVVCYGATQGRIQKFFARGGGGGGGQRGGAYNLNTLGIGS